MVQKISWSAEAEKNLREIKEYIEKDSLYYAERFVRQVFAKVSVLLQHPEFGKPVSKHGDIVLRRILHKSYRIIYFTVTMSLILWPFFTRQDNYPNRLKSTIYSNDR